MLDLVPVAKEKGYTLPTFKLPVGWQVQSPFHILTSLITIHFQFYFNNLPMIFFCIHEYFHCCLLHVWACKWYFFLVNFLHCAWISEVFHGYYITSMRIDFINEVRKFYTFPWSDLMSRSDIMWYMSNHQINHGISITWKY